MRTEEQIRDELEKALAVHRAADHETMTVAEAARSGQNIKALQVELGKALTAGAEPCAKCGLPPMGMLKTPSYEKPLDLRYPTGPKVTVPAVYEVGCASGCVDEHEIDGEKVSIRVMPGLAATAADAVAAWNALQDAK